MGFIRYQQAKKANRLAKQTAQHTKQIAAMAATHGDGSLELASDLNEKMAALETRVALLERAIRDRPA